MWKIAVLLLVSLVLMVLGRIVKTRWVGVILGCLGVGAWSAAGFLSLGSDHAYSAWCGSLILFMALSDTAGIPVWKRRALPPCVSAKRYGSAFLIVISALCIAQIIAAVFFSLRSFDRMLVTAPVAVAITIYTVQVLFDRVEICANGVRRGWSLSPWDDFESFAWDQKKGDKVELRLKRKSEVWQWLRLSVPPEDREAAQKILEAHLPETSIAEMEA
jgi:hypothetical protein